MSTIQKMLKIFQHFLFGIELENMATKIIS